MPESRIRFQFEVLFYFAFFALDGSKTQTINLTSRVTFGAAVAVPSLHNLIMIVICYCLASSPFYTHTETHSHANTHNLSLRHTHANMQHAHSRTHTHAISQAHTHTHKHIHSLTQYDLPNLFLNLQMCVLLNWTKVYRIVYVKYLNRLSFIFIFKNCNIS